MKENIKVIQYTDEKVSLKVSGRYHSLGLLYEREMEAEREVYKQVQEYLDSIPPLENAKVGCAVYIGTGGDVSEVKNMFENK